MRTQPATAASQDGVTNWRVDPALAGGGILFDHGWHALYCVARWAGVPRGVSARLETRRFHEWPLEDTATLALETASGASRIFLTWAADERSNAIEIDGEAGPDPCRRRRCRHEIEFAASAAGRVPPPCPKDRTIPIGSAGWPPTFCLRRQAAAPGNLKEAVLCARLIDAAQRSSAAGGAWLPFAG